MAVNVNCCPEQATGADNVTDGLLDPPITISIAGLVYGLPVTQVAFEVKTTLTESPLLPIAV